MADIHEMLVALCKQLHFSAHLADTAMLAEGTTNQEFLKDLFEKEVKYRHDEKIKSCLNGAEFPRQYTAGQYVTDEIIFPETAGFESLLNLDFYREGKNVIMYGGTGTGKTMLSILIGMEACKKEIPVKFYRTAGLINLFSEGHKNGNTSAVKKKLNKAQIIILDEFGYVPYDRTGSQLLFDYLSEVHEKKSVILNTNLEFAQWVNVLYDQKMTTALIGRLTHHVELVLFPGTNYRLRESSISQAYMNMSMKEVTGNEK